MRIVVDANVLARARKTGVDVFATNLVQSAVNAAPQDSFELYYFGNRDKGKNINVVGENVVKQNISYIPEKAYRALLHYAPLLPFDLITSKKADVYFFPDFVIPPLTSKKAKKVVIIHDLVFAKFPQYIPARNRDYLARQVPKSAAKADLIITNSNATKTDILKEYHVSSDKVVVINPPIDTGKFKPQTDESLEKVAKKYKLPNKYFLFLSTLEPRKNVLNMLEAYVALEKKQKAEYALVLAGKAGWLADEIIDKITQYKAEGENVITIGFVDHADSPALYAGATAFLYPSFYEGFGIPILEAMACGTPVITSDTGATSETAGDAAMLVDPKKPEQITAAIEEIITKPKLAEELNKKGSERVKNFQKTNAGEQFISAITALLQR